MKTFLTAFATFVFGAAMALASCAVAPAQVRISSLPSAAALTGSELIPAVQSGADVAVTPIGLATFVNTSMIFGTPTPGHCVAWRSATQVEDAGSACGTGGGGGTPGGSSGQLQYNNASAFGGFTMAGDCTIAVPNITCVRTNGTAFGTAATVNTGTSGASLGLLNGNLTFAGSDIFSSLPSLPLFVGRPPARQRLQCGAPAAMSGDCTITNAGVITCPSVNGVAFGTFATQSYATPPAIGGTTPNTGKFSALTDTAITGSTQCLQANSSGVISGTGSGCGGSGGSPGARQAKSRSTPAARSRASRPRRAARRATISS